MALLHLAPNSFFSTAFKFINCHTAKLSNIGLTFCASVLSGILALQHWLSFQPHFLFFLQLFEIAESCLASGLLADISCLPSKSLCTKNEQVFSKGKAVRKMLGSLQLASLSWDIVPSDLWCLSSSLLNYLPFLVVFCGSFDMQ